MNDVAVAALNELADGDYRVFAVDDVEVGIFRLGDKIVAYENVCPHAGGPVCQGQIFHKVEEALTPDMKSAGLRFSKQRHIVCPWHGFEFNLETGCHPGDPRVRLKPVKVAVRGGQIYVAVAE
jgi:nitrite reductase/ring-hydroxylating ferredoxin subunit